MSLAHGILGFLSYQDMSGYDLSKVFQASVQFFWSAKNSQIYLVLEKLEKQGFVTHQWIVQRDKPNKKLYAITPSGRKELIQWLGQSYPPMTAEFKNTFLMKLFFGGNQSPEESIAMLRGFIQSCQDFLHRMETIPDAIHQYSQEVAHDAPIYWQFTADFGRSYMVMSIQWAEQCIKRLEELS